VLSLLKGKFAMNNVNEIRENLSILGTLFYQTFLQPAKQEAKKTSTSQTVTVKENKFQLHKQVSYGTFDTATESAPQKFNFKF
jgi:hypothetical protein